MTQDGIMTFHDFPEFYQNPVIQKLSANKRWTVSTTKEITWENGKKKNKMPIDMYELMHNNRIWGCAWDRGHHPLVDLPTLCETIPTAVNNTYRTDAYEDNIVILDVENRCPEHLKRRFLELPYKYGEISMSGKGLHLVFDFPKDIFEKYPNAITKASLQSEDKDYEIIIADHFITFTRNVLPPANKEQNVKEFLQLFERLCQIQNKSVQVDTIRIDDIGTEQIERFEEIIEDLKKEEYKKSVKDFEYKNKTGYDRSSYEYFASRFYYTCLKKLLQTKYKDTAYTDEEKAIIVYHIVSQKIPYREKHDETRAKMPWLLFIATRMIAKTDKQEQERREGAKV